MISDVIDKRLTQDEAARNLGITTRQLRRILARVKCVGMDGVVHGLVGKPSNHRIDSVLETRIIELWEAYYRAAGLNFKHFTEKLNEREGLKISKEKVPTLELAELAGEVATRDAKPLGKNRYKLQIVKTRLKRAILKSLE